MVACALLSMSVDSAVGFVVIAFAGMLRVMACPHRQTKPPSFCELADLFVGSSCWSHIVGTLLCVCVCVCGCCSNGDEERGGESRGLPCRRYRGLA